MISTASPASIALALAAGAAVSAQASPVKPPDSVPAARFVTVEPNVKLEVVDWGGAGRPMVLLAGLGNAAHVFDDLARDLRANYHVYGITRRGFGRSSAPDAGYSADRIGDDVLAVMDSLHLVKPVLVGHSIAGEELSSIGSRHGEKVSALVYLDAAAPYAFYDTTTGNILIDANDLRRKISALEQGPPSRQVIDELLATILPAFERDLRELRDADPGGAPPPPSATFPDRTSFAAFRASLQRSGGFASPIAELREPFEERPDGSVGRRIQSPEARQADVVRHAAPIARIVDVPGALHYVFLTNQADVVREINAFVTFLSDGRAR